MVESKRQALVLPIGHLGGVAGSGGYLAEAAGEYFVTSSVMNNNTNVS
jgi:hypothetical protein